MKRRIERGAGGGQDWFLGQDAEHSILKQTYRILSQFPAAMSARVRSDWDRIGSHRRAYQITDDRSIG
jgi:hypothetical protein